MNAEKICIQSVRPRSPRGYQSKDGSEFIGYAADVGNYEDICNV